MAAYNGQTMHKILEGLMEKPARHSRFAIGIFLALLLVSPLIGYWIYERQLDAQENQIKESLSRIAQVRAATLSLFIQERVGDAKLSVESPFLGGVLKSWKQQGYRDGDLKRQIRNRLDALKKVYDYVEVAIFDSRGNTLISTEDSTQPVDSATARFIAHVAASKTIQVSSIRELSGTEKARRVVDIGAPFFEETSQDRGRTNAVLLLRFDPQQQIYPALQVEPFYNLPNDVLIAEIRGAQVVALSDSRFGMFHYLDVLPISPKQLLDKAASNGSLSWPAATEGNEIAAVHPMRGAPWFILAIMTENAARSIVRNTALVAAAASAVTLGVLGIGILLWWKYKESEFRLVTLQTETERRLLQQQYDYLSKYANDMIILTDADYRIVEVNDKTLQVFGYPESWFAGKPIAALAMPSGRESLKDNLDILRREGTAIFETSQQRRDGVVFPVEVSARTIDFERKAVSQFICRDITERKEAERKIQSLAYYDNVTMLPNRALLNDRLDQAVHMAMRSAKRVGVLFMDLDNFKNINDSLGHQIGDMLLHAVGQRLLGCVREEDTVARIGGDEFMILLPDLDRGEEARHVAEKVIAALGKPFLLQINQVHTTTSIGISIFPEDSKQTQDLIKYADSALYEAKNHGRNNYQFFTEELNDQITRASGIEHYLRHAMEHDKLCLWYQPQIDARDGRVIGAEALLRCGGVGQDFTAADLIAVAEERGLIAKLGEWTMREACKQCRSWQLNGLRAIPVAVNVSPIQLQQKEFVQLVLEILKESELDASFLELEITETSIMRRSQAVADLTMRLRDFGVRISIDDFGTGYSSLSYLKHIPIDKIKIDQSFVCDMLSDAEDATITQAIVKLGQSLQLRVIAEGVESRAQVAKLLDLGCHEAQGYLYSRAVPSDAFQAFLGRDWRFADAAEIRYA